VNDHSTTPSSLTWLADGEIGDARQGGGEGAQYGAANPPKVICFSVHFLADMLSPDVLSPEVLSPDVLSPAVLSWDVLSPDGEPGRADV
jgi:hypothetical protein